jgi:hypothetical protein
MKKIAITQELLDIANELDNMKLFKEANTLTKIAHLVVAEDYKHDPMVYNPDDAKADVQEAHSMDFLDAMEALNKLVESGELNPNELSQIQSILSDSDDEGPDPFKEMSFDDDHYMTDEELDEQFDNDPSDMNDDDFDEEMMDEDPNAWMYDEDEDEDDKRRDKNHMENDGHYFFQDEDDF